MNNTSVGYIDIAMSHSRKIKRSRCVVNVAFLLCVSLMVACSSKNADSEKVPANEDILVVGPGNDVNEISLFADGPLVLADVSGSEAAIVQSPDPENEPELVNDSTELLEAEPEAEAEAEVEVEVEVAAAAEVTTQKTKVAFIGDQGVGRSARSVLELIKSEGADLLLIQGDLGYDEFAAVEWESNLRNILGKDFPVLTVIGNHENFEYRLYKEFIEQRVDRVDELSCQGDLGVKATCTFGDIQITQVAVGITEVPEIDFEDDYEQFLRDSFEDSSYTWRICSWHKNQTQMQIYTKEDDTGWGVYDACLDAGAFIAMGHAHTYSRTHLLNDFENPSVEHFGDELTLEPGKSFAFVNGLGGHDIKPQGRDPEEWFASVYTADQNATHGVLFCELKGTEGECYFKDISGAVPDRFSIRSKPLG